MSGAIQAVVGVIEIAAGLVLDAYSFGSAGNFLISLGIATLLGYAISLLQNPHKAPLIPIGASYAGTLEPRRILFGQLRISGMYTAPPLTHGQNNDVLDIILTIAGHQVKGFGDIYFNQTRISTFDIGAITGTTNDGLVSNSVTDNGYENKAWIRRYDGSQTTPDFIMFTEYTSWDANHIGKQIAYWAISLAFDTVVYATGVPQISGIAQGALVYDPRQDSTNGGSGSQRATVPSTWTYSTNAALTLRWYLTSPLGLGEAQSRIDDTLVAAAANICDQSVSVPIPVIPGLTQWVSGGTVVEGIGTSFLRDLNGGNFTQVGSNFFPNPHPGTTLFILGPDNAMHAVASIQTDISLTLAATYTGANAFDQVSQWNTSTGTTTVQPRYTCNTLLDCTARFEDNIGQLARAMMGQCIYSGGKWRMYAGAWSGAAFALTEADLVGAVSVQCATPRQNLYNAVRGNFINPARNYQPDEFPPILNSVYSAADGETIYTETNFPCCADIFEAQRNAILVSRVSRDQKVITAQCGMSAYGIKVWETGTITIAELGLIQQSVRCIGWKFTPKGSIELQLQEAYSTDWTDPLATDYALKGANATGALDLYIPYPPTGLTATPVAGGISFKVTLPAAALPATRIQLFEFGSSTPFSSSTLIAEQASDTFFIPKFDTVTRFYWARTLSPQEQTSTPFPAVTGVAGNALSASQVWNPIGNLLTTNSWAIGTSGNQGNYLQLNTNGGGNSVVLGDGSSGATPVGPFGYTEALWQVQAGATGTGNEGFQDSADLTAPPIDPTKSYRVSLWIRYSVTAGGAQFNFGCDTGGNTENLSPGTNDTNPYFVFGNLSSLAIDTWYLLVGIIHGSGYTGADSGTSGIYATGTGDRVTTGMNGLSNGVAIATGIDFKFTPGANGQRIRLIVSDSTSATARVLLTRPRFEMINGMEPTIADLLGGVVDPSATPSTVPVHRPRYPIVARGNAMPIVQDSTFTYTSTPTSVNVSWTAYNVFRPDGTSFPMTAGSLGATSGLSASTTYNSYGYSLEIAPSGMGFATSSAAVGSPNQMFFPPSATYAQLAAAYAGVSTLGHIFQGKVTTVTPASGSGGGGGGGGGIGCPHPDQWVTTRGGPTRAGRLVVGDELVTESGFAPIRNISRPVHYEWMAIECDNGARVTVTLDHRFIAPDGQQIYVKDLRIGQILATGTDRNVEVVAMRLRRLEAEAVSIELDAPHLYLITPDGPLSHNLKP